MAAKRDEIPGGFAMSKYMNERDRDEAEARWWIAAIADELESPEPTFYRMQTETPLGPVIERAAAEIVATYLREQARGATE